MAQQFYFYRYFNPRSLAGATSQRAGELIDECISIHAPSRERLTELKTINENYNFNPRSLAGATTLDDTRCLIYADFNPRSLAGATRACFPSSDPRGFQSTLPRGSDNQELLYITLLADFNPRSLAGATICNDIYWRWYGDFNPRSLAGATHRL